VRKTQFAMMDAAAGQRVVVPPILLPHGALKATLTVA